MLVYTINRLIQLIPVILILSIVVFGFVQLLPGDVIDTLADEEMIDDPEIRKALEKEYGRDKPIYMQYFYWMAHVLQGDFGKSMVTRRPVYIELIERIPATMYLALIGIGLSIIIAIPPVSYTHLRAHETLR